MTVKKKKKEYLIIKHSEKYESFLFNHQIPFKKISVIALEE